MLGKLPSQTVDHEHSTHTNQFYDFKDWIYAYFKPFVIWSLYMCKLFLDSLVGCNDCKALCVQMLINKVTRTYEQ